MAFAANAVGIIKINLHEGISWWAPTFFPFIFVRVHLMPRLVQTSTAKGHSLKTCLVVSRQSEHWEQLVEFPSRRWEGNVKNSFSIISMKVPGIHTSSHIQVCFLSSICQHNHFSSKLCADHILRQV